MGSKQNESQSRQITVNQSVIWSKTKWEKRSRPEIIENKQSDMEPVLNTKNLISHYGMRKKKPTGFYSSHGKRLLSHDFVHNLQMQSRMSVKFK